MYICKTVVLYTHFTPKGPYIKNDRNLGEEEGGGLIAVIFFAFPRPHHLIQGSEAAPGP